MKQIQKKTQARAWNTRAIFAVAVALVVGAFVYRGAASVPAPGVASPPPAVTQTPVSRGSTGDTLKVSARLGHSHVRADAGGAPLHLLVDVDALEAAHQRAPLDVAVVMDQSSSMAGQKLEDAKRAARTLISRLRADDRVTLIRYEGQVHVDVPLMEVGAGRQRLLQAIEQMEARGATNISGGLEAARDELGHDAGLGRVRRILLLSDGHATQGLRDSRALGDLASQIRARGVSITSMGLGIDYNELSMTRVAQEGGGNYYFVEDSDRLGDTFQQELSSLQATVARDAELVLRLAPGVTLDVLYGFVHRKEGGVVRVPLSEFAAGQNKSLLMDLRLPAQHEGLSPVVSVELLYRDLLRQRQARHELQLSALATQDGELLRAGVDRRVQVRRQQILTAGAYEQAMEHYEGGRRQEALRLLERRRQELQDLNRDLAEPRLEAEAEKARDAFRELNDHDASSPRGRAAIKKNRSRSYNLKLVY